MLQLTQNLKDGNMQLLEVPSPAILKGNLLVRNHYSVISSGTESKTVSNARKGYLAKAKSRQKEVKLVFDAIKIQGIIKTYDMVMNKLEALSPLGYSSAGEVIGVGDGVTDFKIGDFVACGGASASHTEIISVPKNLSVKVPKEIDLKYAAFTAIASIAMQGVRQADLNLGESCVIIGLGLIGHLTAQILNASGVKTIGIDIDELQIELARRSNIDIALNRNNQNIEKVIFDFTNGYGADGVIITAASSSLDPVNLAGELCRKKGKVVIVGAVPTGFSRENYYKKELELKMSSSYGPGRYDANYEEKGIDYPIGYVRWTENRNMEAFVNLLQSKKINLDPLITHIYDFENAADAYDLILSKREPYTGVIFKYSQQAITSNKIYINNKIYKSSNVNIGFIGAGSFAQNMMLPNIPKYANKLTVVTSKGNTSRSVAQKFGFNNAATSSDDIFNDKNINTIFIATRHNLHAENVIKSLQTNKNVFVEKPLCLNEKELNEIIQTYNSSSGKLMIGFNRRFAPYISVLKSKLNDLVPKAITYRINAGFIPKEHWTQDLEIGGGRIIGEVCHFIDLVYFIAGSSINSVYASKIESDTNLNDTLNIHLKFENGSIASISYFSNGSKKLSKEYIEVFSGGEVYIIDDIKKLEVYSNTIKKTKLLSQDKGHKREVELFLDSVKNGKPSPIKPEDIFHSTFATFKVLDSLRTNSIISF
jgi:polar amino acid transport system substrate-binding protein